MQRLKGRKLLLCALAVVACGVDPTENEGTPTAITANPDVVFVTQGDSQPVIVSLVDEDGQILEADFEASGVGSGITVTEDPNFLGTTTGIGIRRQARFFVKGDVLTATNFTINAAGLSKTVEVTSVPGSLQATISNPTPALGDTIQITAPEGTFFNETSELTFGGAAPVVVSRDATQITFIPFPNIFGPAVVSDVGVTSNPDLTFTLATPDTVRTDSIIDIGANLTPTSPALGDPVTLVLPPGLKVIPESLVVAAGPPPTLGLRIAGSEVAPLNVTVSADSSTITFVPPPNADTTVIVPGVIAQRLPMYPLELATSGKITSAVIDSIPATLSSATPALGQPVTVNITDGSFTFAPDAALLVGADASSVITAQDANSITFVPSPGAAGAITVEGTQIGGFTLTLPTKTPALAVPEETAIDGTSSVATAPALTLPGSVGQTTFTFDDATFAGADVTADGGVSAQYYKITLGSPGSFSISIASADGAPDLDGVICLDGTCADPDQQDFTLASTAHDEGPATVDLPAGTHILAVVNFDGAPTDWVRVTITRE